MCVLDLHRAFSAPQGYGEAISKRIDAGSIERQEEFRLRCAHLSPHIAVGLVEPGVDKPFQRCAGDGRPAALSGCAENDAAILVGEGYQPKNKVFVTELNADEMA